MAKPDLLFLSQRLPYPPNKGEKIRAFHELTYLARSYTIHLGCLIDDPADKEHIPAIQSLCRDIYTAEITPRIARLGCLRGLLNGQGLSVEYFRHSGLAAWVRRVAAEVRPAVTFVYSSNMAPYVLDLPRTGMRIVDLVDVDSEKWRALAETTRGPMRLIYLRERRKIAGLERRIARECDMSVLVSDAEAELFARVVRCLPPHHGQEPLTRHVRHGVGGAGHDRRGATSHAPTGTTRILGISNGVDYHYFDPSLPNPRIDNSSAPAFVFTGTMDYPPNIDAVSWFATDIFPLLRQYVPDARFIIVGSNPSPAVRGLAASPGVTVTGRVTDVRPYLAHATAAVAPMRIARGIQNKVLEAMAMARPVIATAGALEGIHAEPGREVILANTAPEFAAACVRISRGSGSGIGAAARRKILHDYDWDTCLSSYDTILRSAEALTEPA